MNKETEYYFKAEQISVGYQKTPLIREVDFAVKKGEILVLIGPNGAGKSTILKSITRQLKLLSGVVTLEGEDLTAMGRGRLARTMSVVLTDRIRPELMSCRDVVAMGRYPYTGSLGKLTEKDEEIIRQSMEKVHAAEIADKDFNQLSDGQRQRVMLARAICQQPDIMVLDEPTSFLDIRYKVELLNILRQMAAEGMTVILSLHEIEMAYKLADRVMCVCGDKIGKIGTPEEVFQGDNIAQMFELTGGEYNSLTGSVELLRPEGPAKTLVIGGNGTGIATYRRLQKLGQPFIAGVLFSNDVDVQVARALAQEVIISEAFQPITKECEERLFACLAEVEQVIDCGCRHGVYDEINQKVLEEAKKLGKYKVTEFE